MKFLHLDFLPRSPDLALLVLRLWFAGAMLGLHGWGKLMNFSTLTAKFADPLGIGVLASLIGALAGELLCAAMLVLGLYTRIAALGAAFTMGVAFWVVHGHKLAGPGNGELAYVYLGAFVALAVAGGGRFSLDAHLGAKK